MGEIFTQKSILLVSDDLAEQQAAREVLQAANPGGQIVVANSEAEAFDRIAAEKFDCVFCYLGSGPEVSVNFLTEVWNRAPKSGRFVLAPSIDSEVQIRCAFGAHHYLPTPLQVKGVEAALHEAGFKEAILPNDRLQVLISRIRNIPSKPSIYFEVLRELYSANASATVIASLIEKDLGIAAKLIQVVNSVFYGRAETIHNIEEAVLFLGFDVTASIVLSLEALSRFEKVQPLHPVADQIWAHSQELAALARKIHQSAGQSRSAADKAYLAGLLHDIGKLVLAQNFHQEYRKITRTVEKEKRSLVEVEKEVLGVSHADAGAYLLAVWGLPIAIVEAVAFHHTPCGDLSRELTPATAIHIAEEILESEKPLEEIIGGYPPELGLPGYTVKFSGLVPDRPVRKLAADVTNCVPGEGAPETAPAA